VARRKKHFQPQISANIGGVHAARHYKNYPPIQENVRDPFPHSRLSAELRTEQQTSIHKVRVSQSQLGFIEQQSGSHASPLSPSGPLGVVPECLLALFGIRTSIWPPKVTALPIEFIAIVQFYSLPII
jgi:hypothetical protein